MQSVPILLIEATLKSQEKYGYFDNLHQLSKVDLWFQAKKLYKKKLPNARKKLTVTCPLMPRFKDCQIGKIALYEIELILTIFLAIKRQGALIFNLHRQV